MNNGRVAEIRNCVSDIVYFAENYYTTADLNGVGILPLYKDQKRVLRGMVENRNICTLGARQVGLTTLNAIYALWEVMFICNTTVMIASHRLKIVENIMDRIKFAYDKMPEDLKVGVDVCNKREIRFKNGSRILATSASGTAMRGVTINTLILDNAAYINQKNMEELLNAIIPVINSSSNNKIILSSCPSKGSIFDEIFKEHTNSIDSDWHCDVIKWNSVPGRTRKWKSNMIATIGFEGFQREFECEIV